MTEDLYTTNELDCPDCHQPMTFCGYLELPDGRVTEIPIWFCGTCWDTWNPLALAHYQDYQAERDEDARRAERAQMAALL